MPTRLLLTSVLALILGLWAPQNASAEETVLLDEWSAVFEGGDKQAWEHEVIVERAGIAAGEARFVRTQQRWSPVDGAVVVRSQREVTDSTGRILEFSRSQSGPRGQYKIALKGADYTVAIRKNAPLTGTLKKPGYSLPLLCILIMKGELKPGEHTVTTVDLPGDGVDEKTFQLVKTKEGHWRFEEDGVVMLRRDDLRLIRVDAPKDRPHFLQLPASQADAANLGLKAPNAASIKNARRVSAKTVTLTAPAGAWRQLRKEDPTVVMAGMEYATGVLVAAMELPVPVETTEAEFLGMAANVRQSINERGGLPTFGEPSLSTFHGKRAVTFPLDGLMKMEPVEGRAWMLANRNGEVVLVFGFYAKDLREICAPRLTEGFKGVDLDGVAPKDGAWVRVHIEKAGFTMEIPRTWKQKPGAGYHWLSPNGASQVVVSGGVAKLEGGVPATQKRWFEALQKNPSIKGLKIASAGVVDVDGIEMHRTRIEGGVAQGEGLPDLAMVGVSTGHQQPNGKFIQIIHVAFPDVEAEALTRMLGSLRWTVAPPKDAPKKDAPKKDG